MSSIFRGGVLVAFVFVLPILVCFDLLKRCMGRGYLGPCSCRGMILYNRLLDDWEVDTVKSILVLLHGKRAWGEVEDMVPCTDTKSVSFLLNLFTMPSSQLMFFLFVPKAFGTCECSPSLAFLLRRQ